MGENDQDANEFPEISRAFSQDGSNIVTKSTENVFQASRCKGGFAHLEKGEANGGERGGRPVEFKSTFRRTDGRRNRGTDGRSRGKEERRQRRYLCTYVRGFKGPRVSQSAIGVEEKKGDNKTPIQKRRNCHMN